MPISETHLVHRIARVLCAQRLSSNASGSNPSAASVVDAAWREHLHDASEVLRTMREPDAAMASAGDPAIWERMVRVALGEDAAQAYEADSAPASGIDKLYTGP